MLYIQGLDPAVNTDTAYIYSDENTPLLKSQLTDSTVSIFKQEEQDTFCERIKPKGLFVSFIILVCFTFKKFLSVGNIELSWYLIILFPLLPLKEYDFLKLEQIEDSGRCMCVRWGGGGGGGQCGSAPTICSLRLLI